MSIVSLGPRLGLALAMGLSACHSSDSPNLEAESPSDGAIEPDVGGGGATGARGDESGIMLYQLPGPYARVSVNDTTARGNISAGFDLSTGEVVLVWGYDGADTRSLRWQETAEQIEAGRALTSNIDELAAAMQADDELENGIEGRACQGYSMRMPYDSGFLFVALCDDRTYSAPTEAYRTFAKSYLEQIPPPPPLE
ncbi:MAG: hypothetical protein AAGA56_26860 [Myxococcota bacterium]